MSLQQRWGHELPCEQQAAEHGHERAIRRCPGQRPRERVEAFPQGLPRQRLRVIDLKVVKRAKYGDLATVELLTCEGATRAPPSAAVVWQEQA